MSNRLASRAVAGLVIGGVLLSAGCTGHHQGTVNGAGVAPVGGTSTPSVSGSHGHTGGAGSSSSVTSSPKSPSSSAGHENGASAGGLPPCTLVPSAQVTKTLGGKVDGVTVTTTPIGNPACIFVLERFNGGGSVSVTVTTRGSASATLFKQTKASAIEHGSVSVAGVGENAYYNSAANDLQFYARGFAGAISGAPRQASSPNTKIDGARLKADLIALSQAVVAQL
jgi:hypothetical protein